MNEKKKEEIKEAAKIIVDASFGDEEAKKEAEEKFKRLFGKSARIEFY